MGARVGRYGPGSRCVHRRVSNAAANRNSPDHSGASTDIDRISPDHSGAGSDDDGLDPDHTGAADNRGSRGPIPIRLRH